MQAVIFYVYKYFIGKLACKLVAKSKWGEHPSYPTSKIHSSLNLPSHCIYNRAAVFIHRYALKYFKLKTGRFSSTPEENRQSKLTCWISRESFWQGTRVGSFIIRLGTSFGTKKQHISMIKYIISTQSIKFLVVYQFLLQYKCKTSILPGWFSQECKGRDQSKRINTYLIKRESTISSTTEFYLHLVKSLSKSSRLHKILSFSNN